MIVKAVRPFISAQFGNVEPGRVLEMPDAKARFLMRSGLVVEHASPLPRGGSSSFQQPVGAGAVGSSSQADQALRQKIVKPSEGGEPRVTYRRRGKSRS